MAWTPGKVLGRLECNRGSLQGSGPLKFQCSDCRKWLPLSKMAEKAGIMNRAVCKKCAKGHG